MLFRSAARVLQSSGPYCCRRGQTDINDNEYSTYRVSRSQICITGKYPVSDMLVDVEWLRDPTFNLPSWYRSRVADFLRHQHRRPRLLGEPMHDALALEAQEILMITYLILPRGSSTHGGQAPMLPHEKGMANYAFPTDLLSISRWSRFVLCPLVISNICKACGDATHPLVLHWEHV